MPPYIFLFAELTYLGTVPIPGLPTEAASRGRAASSPGREVASLKVPNTAVHR